MDGTMDLLEIVIVVLLSSAFSFGGGAGPIAVIQDRWVGHGLLSPELFAWALALGYLSPGPKAGFIAGVGYYMYGLQGAAAAVIGIVLASWIGAAGVSYAYKKLAPVINMIALPAGFVICGMIFASAWNLMGPMELTALEYGAVALVAIAVGWRNLDSVIVVLGSALVGVVWWLV